MPVEGTMSTGSESKMREDRTVCRTWAINMMVIIMRRRMVMITRISLVITVCHYGDKKVFQLLKITMARVV